MAGPKLELRYDVNQNLKRPLIGHYADTFLPTQLNPNPCSNNSLRFAIISRTYQLPDQGTKMSISTPPRTADNKKPQNRRRSSSITNALKWVPSGLLLVREMELTRTARFR
jgi:hypothetical protein